RGQRGSGCPRTTRRVDVPGIPRPPGVPGKMVSWGVLAGTRVGYIIVNAWANDAGIDFLAAIRALTIDQQTDGLIVDFRYNTGGNMFLSNDGLNLLFRDPTPTIGFDRRDLASTDHLRMVTSTAPSAYVIDPTADPDAYDRPIAVL